MITLRYLKFINIVSCNKVGEELNGAGEDVSSRR